MEETPESMEQNAVEQQVESSKSRVEESKSLSEELLNYEPPFEAQYCILDKGK